MTTRFSLIVASLLACPLLAQLPAAVPATAAVSDQVARSMDTLYQRARKSVVAVQYTWESELGRREVVGAGVVVSADGLVMFPMALVDLRIPASQMKDFKVLLPSETADVEEFEADFLGRDERSDVAFLRPRAKRDWQPIQFVARELNIGDRLWSVGVLPKIAGYQPYIQEARAAARLRGDQPQVLVSGPLASVGSPVFNVDGEAIGLVGSQNEQAILLNEPKLGLAAVSQSPVLFILSDAYLASIAEPPQGAPLALPWLGVMQLVGVNKEVADYFNLKGQTAVQIGDIIPGGPAERAGLKSGMIITRVNGQPIPRGDEAEELPMILRRMLLKMRVGQSVNLSLLDPRSGKPVEKAVQLEQRPKQPTQAERFYAEDLGFSIREMMFSDAYIRRLATDTSGALVAVIRPQSAAQSARLEGNDMVVELNGQAIKSLDQFKREYQQFRKDHPQQAVVMVVLREGRNQTIRIEPPQ